MTAFNSVAEALEELVPPFDSIGDWDEIVHRAVPPRVRRPRLVAGVIAFAVLVALLATPAFGVQSLVLQLLGRKDVSFSSSPVVSGVVKEKFENLTYAAPTNMGVQVITSPTRVAGTFVVAGRRRRLLVATTKGGGFCWQIEHFVGSCRVWPDHHSFEVGWMAKDGTMSARPIVTSLVGVLTWPAAERMTIHYADGTIADVPFIWVSKPIDAGFYSYDIPIAHRTVAKRVQSVTLEDSNGKRLGIRTFR
jgi:hypothetical protein